METWGMVDGMDVVPVHQLLTAAKYGGVVLGAFDGERMVALAYGFIGLYEERPILCSHMLAVLPEYRGQGLGYQLKLEQRRRAIERGLTIMHWTYDPLELVNGNLNIRRLGATCRTYVRNLYGAMTDGMNAGLPSDRLVAEWDLQSSRTLRAMGQGEGVQLEPMSCHSYDGSSLPGDGSPLNLVLPRNFQAIKGSDPNEALRWRLLARAAFERAFAAGYRLTGAYRDGYILTLGEEFGLAH